MKDEIKNNLEQEKTNTTPTTKESDKSKNHNSEKQETTDKNLSKDEKIKDLEEKLARSLAEMENQRRRFEKERQEAFEFGGFNFAKENPPYSNASSFSFSNLLL